MKRDNWSDVLKHLDGRQDESQELVDDLRLLEPTVTALPRIAREASEDQVVLRHCLASIDAPAQQLRA
jgi:hypothetical protein